MAGGVLLVLFLTGGHVPASRLHALLGSVLGVIVGGGIYGLLALKSGLMRQVLGTRFRRLQRFM